MVLSFLIHSVLLGRVSRHEPLKQHTRSLTRQRDGSQAIKMEMGEDPEDIGCDEGLRGAQRSKGPGLWVLKEEIVGNQAELRA